jgi:hypothetical protein
VQSIPILLGKPQTGAGSLAQGKSPATRFRLGGSSLTAIAAKQLARRKPAEVDQKGTTDEQDYAYMG